MKISPLMKVFKANGRFETLLVHTGQHYDENMSKWFFDDLEIPRPDINLEVGSGSHAAQTADIMKRFEPVVLEYKPDYVLVVGDVNSTIACGLVAVKLGVKLIHVEAGLRSFDQSMPEEINRILTDRISNLLFVTEQSGINNLKNEGIDQHRIHLVGNVMIDTLLANREKAKKSTILHKLKLSAKQYGVITLHRPSNVDDPKQFEIILRAFDEIQQDLKLVFPIHPRSHKNINSPNLQKLVEKMANLLLIEPVSYLDFLCLMSQAALMITDSGGIQEETTILGIPCLTLRKSTERPITIEQGTNRLVPLTTEGIVNSFRAIIAEDKDNICKIPELWDGKAAERIVKIIGYHHNKAG